MRPEDIDKLADEVWNKMVTQQPEEELLSRLKKNAAPYTDKNGKIDIYDVLPLLTMEAMEKSFNMTVELLKRILTSDKTL